MLKQKVLIEVHTRDLNHNKHFPLTEACPNSLIFVGTFLAALVVTYLRTLPVMVLKQKYHNKNLNHRLGVTFFYYSIRVAMTLIPR